MKSLQTEEKPAKGKSLSIIYVLTVFTMALTGFGQMPIYKRYYLSDIPGMAWVANFYITRYIHYIGAMVLFALIMYSIIIYLFLQRKKKRLTGYGYAGVFLMAGTVITGVVYTLKSLPGYFFSHSLVHTINLGHMGFATLFLAVSIFALLFKKRWVA